MASPSPSPHLHRRYQYQMLPSKDNSVLNATFSPGSSPTGERDEEVRRVIGLDDVSWKKQARLDLKLSTHRDT
jgi:hypothetical protein